MAVAEPFAPPSVGTLRGRAVVRLRRRRASRTAVLDRFAIGLLLLMTVLAVVTPWIAPHSATVPAGPAFAHPGSHYFLGTDEVGRDIFTRVLYGLRTSWWAALVVILSGVLIGGTVGLIAGASG